MTIAVTDPLLPERLARAITLGSPMPVAQFMAAANAHYYGTRDPLGVHGDFITAPEISQMFGEMIGLWMADLWLRAGQPKVHYVELGPGRGTLAKDARRSMDALGLKPTIHFVEQSAVFREAQARLHPDAIFHDDVTSLPTDLPLLIVGNEFFDALPSHQLVRGPDGWHERVVACQDTLFLPIAGRRLPDEIVPDRLRGAMQGSIIETSPASVAIMRALARALTQQGGAALIIDYGYEGPALGDTLQAVRSHEFVNPFEAPGEHDLTTHVDFATLAAMSELTGAHVHGPTGQGAYLAALGIEARAFALIAENPERSKEVATALKRLIDKEDMGSLFRAMAVTGKDWPVPEGFAPA